MAFLIEHMFYWVCEVGPVDSRRRGSRMTAVLRAYRFALDPTTGQEAALRSH
jgi:hypothetical protein